MLSSNTLSSILGFSISTQFCSVIAISARQVAGLKPFTFTPLPLKTVQPEGWIKDQMQLMATGLAGHEMDFYPIVKDNRWLGGSTDYSDLNEGLPYWFNGLVPLTYALNDSTLISQVQKVADYVLDHQDDRGWLGPETSYDSSLLWGRFPFVLGLTQLAEADPSYTARIVSSLQKFVSLTDELLSDGASEKEEWGRARHADMSRVVQWLYEYHAPSNASALLGTMSKLQSWGLDWAGFYTEEKYPFADLNTLPVESLPLYAYLHAVNVAQGLKTLGVDYRHSQSSDLAAQQHTAVDWTFTYHGSPSGSVLGDERFAGLGPWHGSETCTTVEAMQTLTYLYQLFGDFLYADRAELAAYNALPAAMTPDHWAHNYLSLPNEPWASKTPEHEGLFYNTGDDSIVYGVQPNYPCCAVNHPQGWPKLVAATFSRATDYSGLAHTVLGPGSVAVRVGENDISIVCDTAYPFADSLKYTITASDPFKFYIRVPGWQNSAPALELNGEKLDTQTPDEHGVLILEIPAGDSTLSYTLAPGIRVEQRANNSVSIHRGALLYALDIGQTSSSAPPDDGGSPAEAATVFYNNTQPWNLAIDTGTLQYNGPAAGEEVVIKNPAWEYQAPPNSIIVEACEIEWPLFQGIPAQVPLKGNRKCIGERKNVTMRPYGSLRSRIAELPTIED